MEASAWEDCEPASLPCRQIRSFWTRQRNRIIVGQPSVLTESSCSMGYSYILMLHGRCKCRPEQAFAVPAFSLACVSFCRNCQGFFGLHRFAYISLQEHPTPGARDRGSAGPRAGGRAAAMPQARSRSARAFDHQCAPPGPGSWQSLALRSPVGQPCEAWGHRHERPAQKGRFTGKLSSEPWPAGLAATVDPASAQRRLSRRQAEWRGRRDGGGGRRRDG